MEPYVLILSYPGDSSARRVLHALRCCGCQALLLDTAAFPQALTLAALLRDACWTGYFCYQGRRYDLEAIRSIYVRRPHHYQVREDFPELIQLFLENEAYRGFGGVLRSLDCLWVNSLDAQRRASFKPLQLKVAQEVGLRTPPTLITNDPTAVRSFFFEVCQEQMIYKTLHGNFLPGGGDRYHLIFTSRVGRERLAELEQVRLTAHLFQPLIEKAYEVRATVIGSSVLPVRIDSQEVEAARLDWRAACYQVRYRPYALPEGIARRCVELVRRLGLVFGALDLIVTPDEDYIFLECNPGGQWEWLEVETGLPFAATIAQVLSAGKAGLAWPVAFEPTTSG
uniref:ATP-grasp ribosomal peptide maturase n=1 Tax=Thermogemmatispora argillosa TaxID=2045280 RepID=A0A455T0U5_9CHLR|nr:ATP-grasp ribosomal peptide maturase [Thermogemmatispora argillosa]